MLIRKIPIVWLEHGDLDFHHVPGYSAAVVHREMPHLMNGLGKHQVPMVFRLEYPVEIFKWPLKIAFRNKMKGFKDPPHENDP
jgi:hypothetical protein